MCNRPNCDVNWNNPSHDEEMPDLIVMGPEDDDDVDTIQTFHCELYWNDLIEQGYNLNEAGIISGKYFTRRILGVNLKQPYGDGLGEERGSQTKKHKATESNGGGLNSEL
jgi:hypothetical protein